MRMQHDQATLVGSLAAKRVLVTGGSGSIGKAVIRRFHERGAEVISVDRREPQAADRIEGVIYHRADIRDPGQLRPIFEDFRPEIVIHLAGLARPRETTQVGPYMELNFGGTLAVLEACRLLGEHVRVIVASSGHVYGQPRGLRRLRPFRRVSEKSPTRPTEPYARSKRAAEELCELWQKYGLASVVFVRLGNCFGGSEDRGVVGKLLRELDQGKPVVVRREERDFIHEDDLTTVLGALAVSDVTGPLNVGSGRSHSAEEVLKMLAAARGRSPERVEVKPRAPGDASHIRLNVHRLEAILKRSGVPARPGARLEAWIKETVTPLGAERPNGGRSALGPGVRPPQAEGGNAHDQI